MNKETKNLIEMCITILNGNYYHFQYKILEFP